MSATSLCLGPGKGRGLVATAKLSPGDLLLASNALALVLGSKGNIPETGDLVRTLKYQQLTVEEQQWLRLLLPTQPGSSATANERGTSLSSTAANEIDSGSVTDPSSSATVTATSGGAAAEGEQEEIVMLNQLLHSAASSDRGTTASSSAGASTSSRPQVSIANSGPTV
jgi:hypothetical protein